MIGVNPFISQVQSRAQEGRYRSHIMPYPIDGGVVSKGTAVAPTMAWGKSLTKSENRAGPKMEPCGTPENTFKWADTVLPTVTACVQERKKD